MVLDLDSEIFQLRLGLRLVSMPMTRWWRLSDNGRERKESFNKKKTNGGEEGGLFETLANANCYSNGVQHSISTGVCGYAMMSILVCTHATLTPGRCPWCARPKPVTCVKCKKRGEKGWVQTQISSIHRPSVSHGNPKPGVIQETGKAVPHGECSHPSGGSEL